jgi:hypothetical protein
MSFESSSNASIVCSIKFDSGHETSSCRTGFATLCVASTLNCVGVRFVSVFVISDNFLGNESGTWRCYHISHMRL